MLSRTWFVPVHNNQGEREEAELEYSQMRTSHFDLSALKSAEFLKYFSLVALIVQTTFVALLLRYTRVLATADQLYNPTTAVLFAEIIKLVTCVAKIWNDAPEAHLDENALVKSANHVYHAVIQDDDLLKMILPAALYAVQSNLIYLGASNLDPISFQVGMQFKIITTAVFARIMLDKRIDNLQKCALGLLTSGIILVQTSAISTSAASTAAASSNSSSILTGAVAIFLATCSSGFASCYFESRVKRSDMWVRNVQLAIFGTIFSFMLMLVETWDTLATQGIFHGYNVYVWTVILGQALGGIMVAMTLKYADSILKSLTTCVAILLCSVFSIYLFDTEPTGQLFTGIFVSLAAMWLYISRTSSKVVPERAISK